MINPFRKKRIEIGEWGSGGFRRSITTTLVAFPVFLAGNYGVVTFFGSLLPGWCIVPIIIGLLYLQFWCFEYIGAGAMFWRGGNKFSELADLVAAMVDQKMFMEGKKEEDIPLSSPTPVISVSGITNNQNQIWMQQYQALLLAQQQAQHRTLYQQQYQNWMNALPASVKKP